MNTTFVLIKRNIKLFFKDKAMFFTSLITPIILLVLYATFLGNVYRDSFVMSLPNGITLDEKLLNGLVGGQLVSSILAVSCVTVAFCSNFLMVQDRANGTVRDLSVSPVKAQTLAFSYYIATIISTLIVCLSACAICITYIAFIGWYLSFADVLLILADIVILVLFGTALSSVIGFFMSTQGQISAVGSIISSTYGFVCGAYMPISQFSDGLQKVISFLPGTYGTSLLRNHALGGAFRELEKILPAEVVEMMRDAIDCNLYFFDNKVPQMIMLAILCASVAVLVITYILMNISKYNKNK